MFSKCQRGSWLETAVGWNPYGSCVVLHGFVLLGKGLWPTAGAVLMWFDEKNELRLSIDVGLLLGDAMTFHSAIDNL